MTHLEEMKSLKEGDKIVVYNCDLRENMFATVKNIEILDEGKPEEDIQVYFIDEGTYEDARGCVRNEETCEMVRDYMGWCTACDYIGRVE